MEPQDHSFLSTDWAVREVDHLFNRLRRYTRFVFFSKWFLVFLAVALIGTLIAFPYLDHAQTGLRVSFVDAAQTKALNASAPVMNHPEYNGVDEKGQQFKVTGLRATQQTPSLVLIEQVEAQLLTASGAWRSLTATRAEYDQDAQGIELIGAVTLVDDQGYQFSTERAYIHTKTMEVTGDQPVTAVGPLGNLLASGFKIRDSGKHIQFVRGQDPVRLHIDRKRS